MDPVRSLLATALLSALATAQSTLIVDAAMGPGAQYADLPAAVAAATRGDKILLRPTAVYSPVVIGQALEIRSENPAQRARTGRIMIQGLGALDSVVLADLVVESGSGHALTVQRCDAAVRIENVEVAAVSSSNTSALFEDALHVDTLNLLGLRSLVVERSYLRAEGLRLLSGGAGPALQLTDSFALLKSSIVTGFSAAILNCAAPAGVAPTSACELQNSELKLDDSSLVRGGSLSQFLPPSVCSTAADVDGVGLVAFNGAGALPVSGPSVTNIRLDWYDLDAPSYSAPGTVTLQADIGSLPNAALFASVPSSQPFQLNLSVTLWLDLNFLLPLSVETPDAQGVCTWNVQVPPTLALGLPLAWQALVDPFSTFALSEPRITIQR